VAQDLRLNRTDEVHGNSGDARVVYRHCWRSPDRSRLAHRYDEVHLRVQEYARELQGHREDIGRAILLGLEVLVAADIVRTVAVTPTLTSVAVLAGIVLIRTFPSFSLEVELEGRLPWQTQPAVRAEDRMQSEVKPSEGSTPCPRL
jgi:hypothetical protein